MALIKAYYSLFQIFFLLKSIFFFGSVIDKGASFRKLFSGHGLILVLLVYDYNMQSKCRNLDYFWAFGE